MTQAYQDALAEVEALHRFIAQWFQGVEANTSENFQESFARRLDPRFIKIQLASRVLSRDALLSAIREGHGTNSAFTIEIRDLTVHREFDGGRLLLVTFTEVQSGAKKSSPPTNARLSSVLFERVEGAKYLNWLHSHETKTDILQ
jgi:hypothetical protein